LIIWRGSGFLVVVIAAIFMLGIQFVGTAVFGNAWYAQNSIWVGGIGLLLAGVAVWPVAQRLNGEPDRVLVDQATGQPVVLKCSHSLFFVPVQYWTWILGGIGLLMIIGGVLDW